MDYYNIKDFENFFPELREQLKNAIRNLSSIYSKTEYFVVIEVEGYYCVASKQFLRFEEMVAPFDNERTYPLKSVKAKFVFTNISIDRNVKPKLN